jgi:hypothetical protein
MKTILPIIALMLLPSLMIGQTLSIVASGGDAGPNSGTNWSIDGTVLTVSGTASINAAVINTKLQSGSLTIKGNTTTFNVTISESISNSTSGNILTVGENTNLGVITIDANITNTSDIYIYGKTFTVNGNITTTVNGSILLDAESGQQSYTGVGITLESSKTLSTQGNGSITLIGRGGNTTASMYGVHLLSGSQISTNTGSVSITGYSGSNANSTNHGVVFGSTAVESAVQINTTGGNITIDGSSLAPSGSDCDGIRLYNSSMKAGSGSITLQGSKLSGHSFSEAITFQNGGGNIFGDANNQSGPITFIGDVVYFTNSSSNKVNVLTSGAIVFESKTNAFTSTILFRNTTIDPDAASFRLGKSTNTTAVDIESVVSIAGPITVYGGSTLTLGANLTTNTSGDISIYTENSPTVSASHSIITPGQFKLMPVSVSFTSGISYPIGNLSVSSNGLQLGKSGNTASITLTAATTTSGPVSIHSGDFTTNSTATLTATGNPLMVNASGAVILNTALSGSTTTVNVQGNLQTTGSLTYVNLAGTNSQMITGTGTVQNVTVNKSSNGVTIASGVSNKLYVTGVFTPTSGVTTTNGNLVLRSTSTEDGVMGVAGTCPTEPFSGPVTVEKYIPSKRAFRFLTPGVTTSTSINANWQEGGVISSTAEYPQTAQGTANPNPGYGTHITGGSSNGLDPTLSGNPSLFTYNVNTNAWVAVTNTSTPTMRSGEGYRILVRGSRAMNLNDNAPVPDATILRTTGTLNVCGSVTFNSSSIVPLNADATGYSLVGNPYWSVVDWSLVDKSNIETNLYYWDPTVNGTNGRGAYVTVNTAGVNNLGGSSLNQYIQPGQAFFVKNTGTSPQLTFDRSDVVPGNRRPIFVRAGSLNGLLVGQEASDSGSAKTAGEIEGIRLSLFLKGRMPQSGPTDGALVCFRKDFTEGYGREDAAKLSNLDENLAAMYRGRIHSILGLPSWISGMRTDTIPLRMWNLYPSEYVLRVGLQSMDPAREVWLLDRSSGRSVKVTGDRLDHSFIQAAGVANKDDLLLVVHLRVPGAKEDGSEEILLYPNPSVTEKVSFAVPMEGLTPDGGRLSSTAEVVDLSGTLRLSKKVELDGSGRGVLEVPTLNRGTYVLRIQVGGKVFISKMIRQ